MGLKATPPQLIWAKEGELGVAASPVSLQRRTDVWEIFPGVMTRLAAGLADTPGRVWVQGRGLRRSAGWQPLGGALAVLGWLSSAASLQLWRRTHPTPRTPPTAQSPLHHSNSSLAARVHERLSSVCVRTRAAVTRLRHSAASYCRNCHSAAAWQITRM